MRGAVEDEVAEAEVEVGLDALDGLVGIARADEARRGLLVVELVGEARELARIVDALLGLGGQRERRPEAAVLDGGRAICGVRELDLDHALDAGRVDAGLLGARCRVRQQALRVELEGLARGRDEAALGAGEARALGPAGGDPDGDRLLGQVVDDGAAGPVPLALEVHLVALQSLRISATASRRRSRRSPAPGQSTPVGATSFIASPEPRPRKMRPGARQPSVAKACATTAGW